MTAIGVVLLILGVVWARLLSFQEIRYTWKGTASGLVIAVGLALCLLGAAFWLWRVMP
jgi:predicted acyltransferase